ncbi:hypothetical protein KR215_011671 [Drosophila sulfurigaster]|nr:hypothetical protein KR215_011671 [Drosophila sulfurigaster]
MSSSLHLIFVGVFVASLTAAVSGELSLVSRSQWRARAPGEMTAMQLPLGRAVIAHTAGRECNDDESCAEQVRGIQAYQMGRLKYSDISYHYLIGGNARVYEGRSPSQQGAIAAGNNGNSLAIAFIGNFDERAPSETVLAAAKSLLEHAEREGQLTTDYKLLGHRQVSATKSPGDALYALLEKWPHFNALN